MGVRPDFHHQNFWGFGFTPCTPASYTSDLEYVEMLNALAHNCRGVVGKLWDLAHLWGA